jgi:hypothetical protein
MMIVIEVDDDDNDNNDIDYDDCADDVVIYEVDDDDYDDNVVRDIGFDFCDGDYDNDEDFVTPSIRLRVVLKCCRLRF